MSVQRDGENGFKLRSSSFKSECAAKLDGAEYPLTGPTALKGMTISARIAPKDDMIVGCKRGGKPETTETWTASPDGKTITVERSAKDGKELSTTVFERT